MIQPPSRLAIVGNTYQAEKSASIRTLVENLRARGAEILQEEDLHGDFQADVCVVVGGDGTFLEAARRVGDKHIPILGINTGRLGFLADFSPEEIPFAIEQLWQGELRCEERSVLQVSCSQGELQGFPYALNEVALLKQDNSSMISIQAIIDGEYLTTYQADGIIVNTPTGSTGYALSVGGPIMSPACHCIGLVPVAPHSLNVRPLSLCDDVEVTLCVQSRSHNFLVAIDGRSEKCREGTEIHVRKAGHTIRVLRRADGSFFRTMRSKLMWGSDIRSI